MSRRPPSHHPGYKNMKMYEHLLPDEYEAKVRCSNCGHYGNVAIHKGKTVEQVVQQLECKNCGCYTLKSETL